MGEEFVNTALAKWDLFQSLKDDDLFSWCS